MLFHLCESNDVILRALVVDKPVDMVMGAMVNWFCIS